MSEINKIVVNGVDGQREFGIEDSEARENVQEIMEGAPEELNSFKEAFEAFKEGSEALAGINTAVEANAKAIEDEAKRAVAAEEKLKADITAEATRAQDAEAALNDKVTEVAGAQTAALSQEMKRAQAAEKANADAIAAEKARAEAAETKAIEQGKRAALIDMYKAIGASYNSNTDTFTFNTVADLSWEAMASTYVNRELVYRLHIPRVAQQISNLRVIAPLSNILASPSIKIQGLNTFYGTSIELVALCKLSSTSVETYLNSARTDTAPVCTYIYDTFRGCSKLKTVFPINLKGCETLKKESFSECVALEELRLINLPLSLNLGSSPLISKASILYIVINAAPTSAITITLHADAYARLAEDADIVAALTAQPLVTLVSA